MNTPNEFRLVVDVLKADRSERWDMGVMSPEIFKLMQLNQCIFDSLKGYLLLLKLCHWHEGVSFFSFFLTHACLYTDVRTKVCLASLKE